MKTHRPDKRIGLLVEALENLLLSAESVDWKYGHDEDCNPLKWNKWVELRHHMTAAHHALAREGKKP